MIGLRCALAFIAAAFCLCASTAYAFEPGRYGSVKLAEPTGEARGGRDLLFRPQGIVEGR